MTPTQPPAFLPVLLGALYQRSGHGELVLEQNDGVRRFYWSFGKLVFLHSEVAGEQFGNYLLRQGVLDLPALKELLADPADERLGEKVVHWGLLTADQRNTHLADLYGLILLNALEHPVVTYVWKEGATAVDRAGGVPMSLDHRRLVWQALVSLNTADTIPAWLSAQRGWKWEAPPGLLSSLSDLPIDPQQAYAISFLGGEPLGFDTLLGVSGLQPALAARLVLALWATGGLSLAEGELPSPAPQRPAPQSEPPAAPVKPSASVASTHTTGKVPTLPPEPEPPPAPPAAKAPKPPQPPPEAELHIEIVDEGPEPGEPRSQAIGLAGAAVPSLDSYLSALEPEPPKPISSGSPNLLALQAPEGASPGAAREPASLVRRSLALAKKLQLQDRPGDAIQALEQGVRSDPDAPEAFPAWLLLGQLRMTNPAWSTRAVEALQQASRINPKAAEPWAVMGEIYHRKGFKANARGCFKKAIELDPSVAVPSDFSMEDRPAEPEEKGPGGVFERLKGLMRR